MPSLTVTHTGTAITLDMDAGNATTLVEMALAVLDAVGQMGLGPQLAATLREQQAGDGPLRFLYETPLPDPAADPTIQ